MPPRSTQYGAGRNLFNPLVRASVEGGKLEPRNPGARENWNQRPRWHGPKRGATANPEAEFAWPVVFNREGAFLRAPEGSRWHTITAEDFRKHAAKFGPECAKEEQQCDGNHEVALGGSTPGISPGQRGPARLSGRIAGWSTTSRGVRALRSLRVEAGRSVQP